jgi:hypothetical protein
MDETLGLAPFVHWLRLEARQGLNVRAITEYFIGVSLVSDGAHMPLRSKW